MIICRLPRTFRGNGFLRIRHCIAFSSSASDDDNEPPSDTNPTPPSPRSRLQRGFRRAPHARKGSGRDMDSIISDFFAKSPLKTANAPRPASSRDSLLETFRSNKRDKGIGGFSRTRDPPSIIPPQKSRREGFLPGTKDRPEEEGGKSFSSTLSKPSSDSPPPTKRSSENLTQQRTQNPADVSELRSALFGSNAKGVARSHPSYSDSNSPLSDIIAAMRASKEKVQENKSALPMVPKWRTPGQGSREEERAADRAIRDNASRLEERVRQRQGKAVADADNTGGKVVQLPSHVLNLTEVSQLFRVSTRELRKSLRSIGELPNNKLDDEKIMLNTETVEYVALDLGIDFERTENSIQSDEKLLLQRRAIVEQAEDAYESFPPRPPVVTIMGHVDHGKTTLMDALRRRAAGDAEGKKAKKKAKKKKGAPSKNSKGGDVAGTEAGGITQVISAFQIPLIDADIGAVTFLDTPGHAAFRAMRQSGSDAADVIVLVVAADDGVSPQTVEIINFYKSIVSSSGGGISMMVALNKIDKPGIDVATSRSMVESQLLEHGIVPEGLGSESEFGPPVQLIPVSGLTGEGLDELIAGLVLQSEVMDLRADLNTRAEGVVLDARVEKGLGVVADCIIRWGSIAKGDIVVSGIQRGKVRILRDVSDKMIKQGLPSQPVRIVGFEDLPKAGDPFVCMESEEEADELIERRRAARESEAIVNADGTNASSKAELQSAGKHLMSYDWRERLEAKHGIEGNVDDSSIRIPVILKADADGTLAALMESLVAIGEDSIHNVVIDPIQVGTGPVLPADVEMAKESLAAIVCFNVKNDAVREADSASVRVLRSDVIYSILDEARVYFGTYLPAVRKEIVHGRAKVGAIFNIGGMDTQVAGLQVLNGKLYRDKIGDKKSTSKQAKALYRVIRNGQVVEGTAEGLPSTSLKHFKDDVTEIERGKECGLSLAGFNDFQEGDEIECWSVSMEHQTL